MIVLLGPPFMRNNEMSSPTLINQSRDASLKCSWAAIDILFMHHIGEPCKAAASWPLLLPQVSNQSTKMLPLRAGHTVHPCHCIFPDSKGSVGFGFDDRDWPRNSPKMF